MTVSQAQKTIDFSSFWNMLFTLHSVKTLVCIKKPIYHVIIMTFVRGEVVRKLWVLAEVLCMT